jgi:hypothetical protein
MERIDLCAGSDEKLGQWIRTQCASRHLHHFFAIKSNFELQISRAYRLLSPFDTTVNLPDIKLHVSFSSVFLLHHLPIAQVGCCCRSKWSWAFLTVAYQNSIHGSEAIPLFSNIWWVGSSWFISHSWIIHRRAELERAHLSGRSIIHHLRH